MEGSGGESTSDKIEIEIQGPDYHFALFNTCLKAGDLPLEAAAGGSLIQSLLLTAAVNHVASIVHLHCNCMHMFFPCKSLCVHP